jgi:hypothetical protein
MSRTNRYTAVAIGAAALSIASPSAGIAAAADYTGQTCGDATSAIGDAGQKAVVATRSGDTLDQSKCVVTHSESAPWLKGDNFAPVTDTVLLDLNCNAAVASAKDPGNSAASPQGRAALQEQEKEAAKKAQAAKQTTSH